MTSSKTTVELPPVHVVHGDDIYRFCKITGDTNKAHEGDKAAVPAFYIDFLVKRLYDEKDSSYQFSRLHNNFREVLRREEPFVLMPLKKEATAPGVLEYSFAIRKDDKDIADGTIEYRLKPEQFQPSRFDKHGDIALAHKRAYQMETGQANEVAQIIGLGYSQFAAGLALAASRTSHALLNLPGRELFEDASGKEKHPFFGSHKLHIYEGLEEALREPTFSLEVRPDKKKSKAQLVYIRGEAKNKPIFDLAVTIFYFDSLPT